MRQGSKNPWIDFEELQKEAKETPGVSPSVGSRAQVWESNLFLGQGQGELCGVSQSFFVKARARGLEFRVDLSVPASWDLLALPL